MGLFNFNKEKEKHDNSLSNDIKTASLDAPSMPPSSMPNPFSSSASISSSNPFENNLNNQNNNINNSSSINSSNNDISNSNNISDFQNPFAQNNSFDNGNINSNSMGDLTNSSNPFNDNIMTNDVPPSFSGEQGTENIFSSQQPNSQNPFENKNQQQESNLGYNNSTNLNSGMNIDNNNIRSQQTEPPTPFGENSFNPSQEMSRSANEQPNISKEQSQAPVPVTNIPQQSVNNMNSKEIPKMQMNDMTNLTNNMGSQGGALKREEVLEIIEENVEKIIEEKWDDILLSIDKVLKWKDEKEKEINMIKEDIVNISEGFAKLETKLVGKIGSYDKNILDVNSEIKALEKVFQKITPTLINNVNELSKVTKDLKDLDGKKQKKQDSY